MTLIVCIDDKKGMLFGTRRQSRDRLLIQRVLQHTKGKRLLVSPYSAPLFQGKEELVILPDPAGKATQEDFVFLEDTPLSREPERLLLYRWNRHYPATRHFSLSLEGYLLQETVDFPGSSHDRISEELWIKV